MALLYQQGFAPGTATQVAQMKPTRVNSVVAWSSGPRCDFPGETPPGSTARSRNSWPFSSRNPRSSHRRGVFFSLGTHGSDEGDKVWDTFESGVLIEIVMLRMVRWRVLRGFGEWVWAAKMKKSRSNKTPKYLNILFMFPQNQAARISTLTNSHLFQLSISHFPKTVSLNA